jgi:hypothetical protein
MRFFAEGPNIPDDLLEQRDRGNVVFFCGAGISRPAGLPNFAGLAGRVLASLGTPTDAKSRALFERGADLDQVFSALQQEYQPTEVENVVSRLLATPKHANFDSHSIVLRLSRNALNRPRVVTTNFDLLFHRCDRSLTAHISPRLPDLSATGTFEGVVYLHGRRRISKRGRHLPHDLILSSADFGRAYLAEGWATRFVRDLLHSHIVVLIGYSASDPPVRYLLEGLRSRSRDQMASRIYAFDHGAISDVEDRWRHLGVVGLAYETNGEDAHNRLWTSLRAWAQRADDPDRWRRSVADLAKTHPRQLQPFQRGQVASIVRSVEGADPSVTPGRIDGSMQRCQIP